MVSYRFLRVFVVSYQELRTRKTLPYAILPSMWSIVGEKGPAPWDARVPLGVAVDRPLSLPVLLPPFSDPPEADQKTPGAELAAIAAAQQQPPKASPQPAHGPGFRERIATPS